MVAAGIRVRLPGRGVLSDSLSTEEANRLDPSEALALRHPYQNDSGTSTPVRVKGSVEAAIFLQTDAANPRTPLYEQRCWGNDLPQ